MADAIPIVADIPTSQPGLGFAEYVEALADAVRGGEPPQFTIGLYGAWGSGKSSLLAAIAENLASDSRVLPVVFDAWRHERADHIVVPLLFRVTEVAQRSGDVALTQHLQRALKALLFSLNFKVAGVGIDAGAIRDRWQEQGFTSLEAAFAKPFEELRQIPTILGGKRIAVLIDDLDRCSPEKVVTLLEAINLVMDVNGFIFILALDYDVLISAVATRYPHVSGHEFMEKMVQLPFRVPPLAVGAEEFLGELIPDWKRRRRQFPDGFAESVIDVAALGLRANPRQIKRLINSFLLVHRIVNRRGVAMDQRLMAAIIGLQLRWPEHYEDLQQAVLAGDAKPFESLVKNDDEALARYATRLFTGNPSNASLRELFQLTAVTVTEPTSADVGPVGAARAEKRLWLVEAIGNLGFQASPRSDRLWYHPQLKDFRIVLQATSVRLERRISRPEGAEREWTLLGGLGVDYRYADRVVPLLESELRSPGSVTGSEDGLRRP